MLWCSITAPFSACRLYLMVNDVDRVIQIYKKNRQYDEVSAVLSFLPLLSCGALSADLRGHLLLLPLYR